MVPLQLHISWLVIDDAMTCTNHVSRWRLGMNVNPMLGREGH